MNTKELVKVVIREENIVLYDYTYDVMVPKKLVKNFIKDISKKEGHSAIYEEMSKHKHHLIDTYEVDFFPSDEDYTTYLEEIIKPDNTKCKKD